MQRLHQEDLTNYLLSQDNAWHHLKIPALANDTIKFKINNASYIFNKGELLHKKRDNSEQLTKVESAIGTYNYHAQYLQAPISENNAILRLEDISFFEKLPDHFDYFIHSWDTAIKISSSSDYSVGICFGILDKQYYLISMIREKMTYPQLKCKVEKFYNKYIPRYVLIEDKASGQQLIQDLRLSKLYNIIGLKPKLDKITRFASAVPLFQSSCIRLPKNCTISNVLLKELLSFPNSKHDDIIDAISQFASFIKGKIMTHRQIIRSL
ncbi:MAG: phage terminase large subunit [Rickettsiaceae bacterium]